MLHHQTWDRRATVDEQSKHSISTNILQRNNFCQLRRSNACFVFQQLCVNGWPIWKSIHQSKLWRISSQKLDDKICVDSHENELYKESLVDDVEDQLYFESASINDILSPNQNPNDLSRYQNNIMAYVSPSTKRLHDDIIRNSPSRVCHHNAESLRALRKKKWKYSYSYLCIPPKKKWSLSWLFSCRPQRWRRGASEMALAIPTYHSPCKKLANSHSYSQLMKPKSIGYAEDHW